MNKILTEADIKAAHHRPMVEALAELRKWRERERAKIHEAMKSPEAFDAYVKEWLKRGRHI